MLQCSVLHYVGYKSLVAVLTDDDIAVLDMVNRVDGDLSQPRPVTGSKSAAINMEEYTPEGKSSANICVYVIPPSLWHKCVRLY